MSGEQETGNYLLSSIEGGMNASFLLSCCDIISFETIQGRGIPPAAR